MLITRTRRPVHPTWLRPYAIDGVVGDDGAAEVYGRAEADSLTRPDMRALLLAPPKMTNSGVRGFVVESLARQPEQAAGILSAHCAQLGVPFRRAGSRKIVTPAGAHFVARASITVGAVTVAGDERRGLDRKSAADAAYVSLLARLANARQPNSPVSHLVEDSVHDRPSWREAVWSPVSVSPRPSMGERLSMLDSNEFFGVLVATADEGVAPVEVIEQVDVRARLGLLDGREVPVLLFATHGPQWNRARLAVLHLLRHASTDAYLLSRILFDRFDELGVRRDPVRYERVRVIGGNHAFEVEAQYEFDGASHRVGPCAGADEWEARDNAQVRILAHLAGLTNGPLPPLKRLPIPDVPGTSASQSLRAAVVWGAITDLDLQATASGPPFVATAQCRLDGELVGATFAGPSADLASAGAARILLVNLNLCALGSTPST